MGMFDNAAHFKIIAVANWDTLFDFKQGGLSNEHTMMYCPPCERKMKMTLTWVSTGHRSNDKIAAPSLFKLMCNGCETRYTVVYYEGPGNIESLVVLHSCHGGLSTKTTPEGISYYLDQASKAKSIGANSAAMAMYRAALEQLLFLEGYKQKMLGPKIEALEKAKSSRNAPKWAGDLSPQSLEIIAKLGNYSIHPNDGDVKKQEGFDNDFLNVVQEFFSDLLYKVYDSPIAAQKREEALKQKFDEFERKTTP